MRSAKRGDSLCAYPRDVYPTRRGLRWITVGEQVEHLFEEDALPRLGFAMRQETGREFLYSDAALLGRVTGEEWFKDYTVANPLEEYRVQYEPTSRAGT